MVLVGLVPLQNQVEPVVMRAQVVVDKLVELVI